MTEPSPRSHGRVLVVDDERAMLRTHAAVLRHHGFTTVAVVDPWEALEELERELPDAVVVDLRMPGMDGLEFATRLRTRLGGACPPVVLVSARLGELSPMESIMFDALFSKPFGIDRFVDCLSRLSRARAGRRGGPPSD